MSRRLISIPPDASPEEVAALMAVVSVLHEEAARSKPAGASDAGSGDALDAWVHAARLSGRRVGMARGSWRLSGRLSRRARA